MKKLMFLALGLISYHAQQGYSHSHHTTYIVEEHYHHHPEVVVVEPVAPVQYVMVDSAPPAEFYEEVTTPPGDNFVWVKGHWGWDGNRYVRVNGQWLAKPHSSAEWVSGSWSEHHGKWRWNEGHWH